VCIVPNPNPLPSENWVGAGPSAALQLLERALLFHRRSALHPDPPRSGLLGSGFWDGNYIVLRPFYQHSANKWPTNCG